MKILLNTFLLALKIETLSFKSGFKILSFFILFNNMRFDAIDFVKPNDSTYYN